MEEITTKTTKPIMMDQWMIDKIHEYMIEYAVKNRQQISFGEATRRLVGLGFEELEHRKAQKESKGER